MVMLTIATALFLSPISALPQPPAYRTALNFSLLFYEAQRSGRLPPTNRIPWRADSALQDRGNSGEDLTGGYYDASDYVKFGFTMTFATTMLSWGLLEFERGYMEAEQLQYGLDAVKWATDYFAKCHVSRYEFYGQVGDFSAEMEFWGRPEDLTGRRKAYKIDEKRPGSDLAGEAAAAMAAASLVFRKKNDTGYAEELLKHAEELFEFAVRFRGLYHNAMPLVNSFYESTGYGDELTWAAIWLYKATKNGKYIEMAEEFYSTFRINDRPNEFYYNKKVAGVQLLLAEITQKQQYTTAIRNFCHYSLTEQRRTPLGLLYIDKTDTLAHAANIAFICLLAALKSSNATTLKTYHQFAKQQIDYILGANSMNQSFLVGYGTNYPQRPYHAASSCPNPPTKCTFMDFEKNESNPHVLYGALVSGTNEIDHYEDRREEALYNGVSLDGNAGFQGVLAALVQLQDL